MKLGLILCLIITLVISFNMVSVQGYTLGENDSAFSLEEQLKLAKERVIITNAINENHPTGIPCNVWTCDSSMFFYPSIIGIGMVSSAIIFILLIKSKRKK